MLKPYSLCALIALSQTPIYTAHASHQLDHFLSLSLEELISLETTIATTSKRTASKAPAVVSLITADEIKASGATNLTEALQTVPGIHIRSSQFANRPLIQFRGTTGNQTLVMINGNSLKDLTWNLGIFWKGIPASIIERIEVIRGPGSALFGADASAGIVNVITKTASRIRHNEFGVRSGSFNTQNLWLQHGNHFNGYEFAFTADFSRTNGHAPFIESDGQTNAIGPSYAPADANYGWESHDLRMSLAKDHWRLQADYREQQDVEIGLTGFGVLDPLTKGEDSRFNLDLFYNNTNFNDNWSLNAELRYQHLDYTSGEGFFERPPGYTDGSGTYPDGLINRNDASERRVTLQLHTSYSGFQNHNLTLGTGYTWQDLYSVVHMVNFGTDADGNPISAGSPLLDISDSQFAFAPEKSRIIKHAFIEDIWTINNNWELTAGARYDQYSDFGNTFNPRAALVWQTTEKLTSKLIYGKAFRPPTYNELFAFTSFSTPNTELDPERSETIELALNYTFHTDLLLALNLFHIQQSDLISRDNNGQYQNIGKHNIRGLEIEARWQATDTANFIANYTARSHDDNPPAIQEADHQAFISLNWSPSENINWNIQSSWIGERERRSNDSRQSVDDHTITDSTLRYSNSNYWEFSMSVRNLFDSDAREFTGRNITNDLPLAKRNIYLEARMKF